MIELESVPELVDPVMVAAFEGWNDVGDAASSAVAHLEREWKGEVFAALDAEDYYDFQVNRPHVWLDEGVRRITWPTTRLSVVRVTDAKSGGGTRDLVLVRGIEPSMRWRTFCNELLGFAHELGVEMVLVLGALLGDTPHTRPVPVTGVTSDSDLARTLHLEESKYEGPAGIAGVLQEACTHAGIPAASLWAAVPHYVAQPPNPKASLALLNRLEDLLRIDVPRGDLPEDARAWQLGVDQLAAEDSEVAEYVQSLEEARDTAELPEASGEAIAKEFERYLRHRDDGPDEHAAGHRTPKRPTGVEGEPRPDSSEESTEDTGSNSPAETESSTETTDSGDTADSTDSASHPEAGDAESANSPTSPTDQDAQRGQNEADEQGEGDRQGTAEPEAPRGSGSRKASGSGETSSQRKDEDAGREDD